MHHRGARGPGRGCSALERRWGRGAELCDTPPRRHAHFPTRTFYLLERSVWPLRRSVFPRRPVLRTSRARLSLKQSLLFSHRARLVVDALPAPLAKFSLRPRIRGWHRQCVRHGREQPPDPCEFHNLRGLDALPSRKLRQLYPNLRDRHKLIPQSDIPGRRWAGSRGIPREPEERLYISSARATRVRARALPAPRSARVAALRGIR